MSRPKLFLHIGLPKTGTTSLQGFLIQNREVLRMSGVTLLDNFLPGNQDLGVAFGVNPQHGWLVQRNIFNHSQIRFARQQLQQSLRRSLDGWEGSALILSDEALHSLSAGSVSEVVSFFQDFDLKVLAWFRKEEDLAKSYWLQMIRVEEWKDFESWWPENKNKLKLFKPSEIKHDWWRSAGRENCVFGVYEQQPHDVREEFLSVIGQSVSLPPTTDFDWAQGNSNARLSPLRAAAFRAINAAIPITPLGKERRASEGYNWKLRRRLSETGSLDISPQDYCGEIAYRQSDVLAIVYDVAKTIASEVESGQSSNLNDSDATFLLEFAKRILAGGLPEYRDVEKVLKLASRARPNGRGIQEMLQKLEVF